MADGTEEPSRSSSTVQLDQVQVLRGLYADYYQHEVFSIEADLMFEVYAELLKADMPARTIGRVQGFVDILDRELTALNIELFGLAWVDYNYTLFEEGNQGSNQLDVALCTEVIFTKWYLEKANLPGTWDAAGLYNRAMVEAAVAQSASVDFSTFRSSPFHDGWLNPSAEKEIKLLLSSFRGHFDKLLDASAGNDTECSLRLSNRVGSIMAWRDGVMVSQKLSLAFAERLGLAPSLENTVLFQRLVVGLYKNAKNYINAVTNYGSWEQARGRQHDFRQALRTFLRGGGQPEQNRGDAPQR